MLVTLEVEAPLAPANTFEFDIGGHGGSHGSAIITNKKVLNYLLILYFYQHINHIN